MNILDKSAQEYLLDEKFRELVQEAAHAYEVIEKNFINKPVFGLNQHEVRLTNVFNEDINSGWYISDSGMLTYEDEWWGGRSYKFEATIDGIYLMLRNCYLNRQKNLPEEFMPVDFKCNIDLLDNYFRKLINGLEKAGN